MPFLSRVQKRNRFRTTTARRCENRRCREGPTIPERYQNRLPVGALGRFLVLRGRSGDSTQRRIPYANNRQSSPMDKLHALRFIARETKRPSLEGPSRRARRNHRESQASKCLYNVPFSLHWKASEFIGWSRCR